MSVWHEAGLTGTHMWPRLKSASYSILLFTLSPSLFRSVCFPVQLATFAYAGSYNFCRLLLPLDAAHQNSLALATST